VEREANRLQGSLDLQHGPLFKAAVFQAEAGDYLLLVAHHLVIDGVSWRILVEDLEQGYTQAQSGQKVEFVPKTHSYRRWSEKLREYGQSSALRLQREYWRKVCEESREKLPGEKRAGGRMEEMKSVRMELGMEQGRALLGEVHRAYGTEINDLLLTALGQAVGAWAKREKMAIYLEGHGREEILSGVDVTRTVGWFTSLYPVILEGAGTGDLGQQLRRTKEMLRRIPHKGTGYGILRYLTELSEAERQELEAGAEITFNYLGHVAGAGGREAGVSSGSSIAGDNGMLSPLNINGIMQGERLGFSFGYDAVRFSTEEIERLAAGYRQKLEALIEDCLGQKERVYTASDLGDLELSEEEIKLLVDREGR